MKRKGSPISSGRNKYARIAAGAASVGRRLYNSYRSGWARSNTKTKTKRKSVGLTGVTTYQRDVKNVYSYKRAPRRLRKKWKKQRRTFIGQQLKALASRKYHYSGNMSWSALAGEQAMYGWFNYGVAGTGGIDGSGDLADIWTRLNKELGDKGTAAQQVQGGRNARRMFFDTMKSRIVLTNVGTSACYIEVYQCMARKDVPVTPEGGTWYQFLINSYNTSFAAELNTGAGQGGEANASTKTTAAVVPNPRLTGLTPFQNRHFCQNFKVNKVTRLFIAPGNSTSFDCGDRRNLQIDWDEFLPLLARKSVTSMYLCRIWGEVQGTENPQNALCNVACEREIDYNVKILDTFLPECNYFKYTNTIE